MPPTTASARTVHWLWPPLLLLGCLTAIIAWLLMALVMGNQAGWMAVVAALEIVWMLRLGTLHAGRFRIGVAVATTALIIIGTNWGIASAQLGEQLGLDPWASAQKMGAGLAWNLLKLANNGFDLLCYIMALLVAWSAAR